MGIKRYMQEFVSHAFFGLFFGMQAFVFIRLSQLVEIDRTWFFYVLLLILTALHPLAYSQITKGHTTFRRWFYIVASSWLGISFILFLTTVIFEIVAFIVPMPNLVQAKGILVSAAVLCITGMVYAQQIIVTRFTVPMRNLAKKVKLVHISDLHVGAIWTDQTVTRIAQKVNELKPDLVVITGDIFDGTTPMKEHMIKGLDAIRAPTYLVTGNHDFLEHETKAYELLGKLKHKLLKNELVVEQGIQIIGIDYHKSKNHIYRVLASLKYDRHLPTLLLNHVPHTIDNLSARGIDMQLSGHTHNGQIFPLNLFIKMHYKYVAGLYRQGSSYVHVSSGTSHWGPPIRFGSSNQITLLTLTPLKEKNYH